MKKTLSVILSLLMAASVIGTVPFSAQAGSEDYYVVGGTAEIFGTLWDQSNDANIMTSDGNGKYTKSYTVDKEFSKVELKVVRDGCWYGDENGDNIEFKITGAGTFTVTFDTATQGITVSGSIVVTEEVYPLEFNSKDVTSKNCSDILGDGEGKVSYDPKAHSLTLNDVDINSNSRTVFYYDDYSNRLVIHVIGHCRIKSGDGSGFGGTGVIKGPVLEFYLEEGAVLDVVCGDWYNYYTNAIEAWRTMYVFGKGTMNVYAGNSPGYGTYAVRADDSSGGGIIVSENSTLNLYANPENSSSRATYSGTKLSAVSGAKILAGDSRETAQVMDSNTIWPYSYLYAGVRPEQKYNITMDANGGTKGAYWEDSFKESEGCEFPVEIPEAEFVSPPQCAEFDAMEFNGTRYETGSSYVINCDTVAKYLWKFTHTLTRVPAVTATEDSEGSIEYYVCPDCGRWYSDAEGKTEITDKSSVVIPKIELSHEDAALPTEGKTEEEIKKTNTDKKDVAGSSYAPLKLKATSKGKTITLKWSAQSKANGYIIYGAPCGKKMTRLATIANGKTAKYTFKKLKKGKYYKYIVVAYKKTAIDNRVIAKSKSVHIATPGGKKGNPTGISVKTKMTVKKGKKVKIKAKLLKKGKIATHIAKLRYESSNVKIAAVDKNGYLKAKKKGIVKIYVYTQNGLCKTIKVKVK